MDLTQQPQLLALVEGPGGGTADVLAVLVVPLDLGSVGLLCKIILVTGVRCVVIILMLLLLERK